MKLKKKFISVALLALFSATFIADILPSAHSVSIDQYAAVNTEFVVSDSSLELHQNSPMHSASSECGDPCHVGTCHFGHCAHVGFVSVCEISPRPFLSQYGLLDLAKPFSPYLSGIQRPPRTSAA